MARRARVLIVGGAGVFGQLLARELVASFDVVIGGRSPKRTAQAARALGVDWRALDLAEPGALATAARGFEAVACTAGPFQTLPRALPGEAVRAGAHWLDIADDPAWVLGVLGDRALDAIARDAGVAVITGLSSTPALSGALVRWAAAELDTPVRACVTLAIGNRNAKGAAAIASAFAGRFRDPAVVSLPGGRRRAYVFDSADETLLRTALGIDVEFRVALEWGLAARFVAAAGSIGSAAIARVVARAAALFAIAGSRGGGVQAEVWNAHGGRAAWAAWSTEQRFAIVPCALAVEGLLRGEMSAHGVIDPAAWCATQAPALTGRGLRLLRATPHPACDANAAH